MDPLNVRAKFEVHSFILSWDNSDWKLIARTMGGLNLTHTGHTAGVEVGGDKMLPSTFYRRRLLDASVDEPLVV